MPTEIFAKKGTVLKADMEIAFAIIVNDSDKNAPGQAGWVGWGNQTIVFGKKPRRNADACAGQTDPRRRSQRESFRLLGRPQEIEQDNG